MGMQYYFNDGHTKGRLVHSGNWFVWEWKYVDDASGFTCGHSKKNIWFPCLAGTKEWLGLTEQDVKWAK